MNRVFNSAIVCMALIAILVTGCKKADVVGTENASATSTELFARGNAQGMTNTCEAYTVTVAPSYNAALDQTTFTWTVVNSNPGNGSNGTAKDLGFWAMPLCERAAANIVAQSNNLGQLVAATYKAENALTCYADNVLKFGYGTAGSTPSVYKLVLGGKYTVDQNATGFFKAGTDCCTRNFAGVSCLLPVDVCALSQGYWFANAKHSWNNQLVTIGGNSYSQQEGQALWSELPGGKGGKAAYSFYQASAALLSVPVAANMPAAVSADIAIINTYLTGLGKLTVTNHPTSDSDAALAAVAAANRISQWICENHCGDTLKDPTACNSLFQ